MRNFDITIKNEGCFYSLFLHNEKAKQTLFKKTDMPDIINIPSKEIKTYICAIKLNNLTYFEF